MAFRPVMLESLEPRALLAVVSWDGGGGDNLWHNPLNWDGDALPGPADTARIDVPGDPLIKYTTGFTRIAELRSHEDLRIWGGELLVTDLGRNHGSLTISGGTLRIRGPWKQLGDFRMTGGALRGAGDFVPTGGGEWSGGRTTGSGRFQLIASGLGLTISGDVMIGRRFVVDAPFSWPRGTVTLVHAGRFHNMAGRTLTMTAANRFTGSSGVFNNGRIVAEGGRVESRLFSAGPSASIEIGAGGWALASGVVRSPFLLAPGATVRFDYPTGLVKFKFRDGAAFSGAGGWEIGRALVEVWVPGLQLSTLRVEGLNQNHGLHLMTDAVVEDLTIAQGRLVIMNGSRLTVERTFALSGGGLDQPYWQQGARLLLLPGATGAVTGGGGGDVLIVNHGEFVIDTAASAGRFDLRNHGTVIKRGSGTAYFGTLSGPLRVEEGDVHLSGVGPYDGAMTIAAGTVVTLSAPSGLAPGGSITGPGRVNLGIDAYFSQNPLIVEGAIDVAFVKIADVVEFRGANVRTYTLKYGWWGGLTIDADSDVVVTNGMISHGYGTEILVAGPSQHGSLTVANAAALYGEFKVRFVNGFSPVPGQYFDLVFFGAIPAHPSALIVTGLKPTLTATFEFLSDRLRLRIS